MVGRHWLLPVSVAALVTGLLIIPKARSQSSPAGGGTATSVSTLTNVTGPLTPTSPPSAAPHPLKGVAAIVEADVVASRYTFDSTLGPRTEVTLANITVHAGNPPTQNVFSHLGGPMPNGKFLMVSEFPVLHPGSRYLFFFAGEPLPLTPVWARLAFRVESLSGRKIVVSPTGHPLIKFGINGAEFGTTQLFDPANQPDPLGPLPLSATANLTAPDVASALDVATFAQSARDVANSVGAVFGTPVLSAKVLSQWNGGPTTPVVKL